MISITPVSVSVQLGKTADVDAAVAAATGLRLMGYSCRESAGSAAVATFRIINGATGATAAPLAIVELAADKSETVWFGDRGISAPAGLSIDHIAGTVDVILYYTAS